MKATKTLILGTIVSFGLGTTLMAQDTNRLSDEKSRVSYAIGMMLGHNWQQQGLEIDPDIAARAIKDVQAKNTTLLTPEEMQQTLTDFQKDFAAKQQQRRAELVIKNKAAGDAFLAANKNQPGIQSLPDGLQYLVLTIGTGGIPAIGDIVTVNYRGTFIDGTEFDSTYKTGRSAQLSVGGVGVIRGWTEALQMMAVGSKWKLFIPAELAYGEAGRANIPPNSTLIFEVDLVGSQAPPTPNTATSAAPLTSDIIKVPSAEEMKNGAKIEVIKQEDAAKAQHSAQ